MMNVRAEGFASRGLVLVGFTGLILVWVAWRVLTLGLADFLSESRPSAALGWRTGHAEAQLQRAERRARASGNQTGLATDARAAIRAAPLDGRGYRMLANHAEARGEMAAATALYGLAAYRGPRDLPSQGWLVKRALARSDYVEAVSRIDQMLRIQPQLVIQLHPVLAALAVDAQARTAVSSVLLTSPPWRLDFVRPMIETNPDRAGLFALVEQLRHSPAGLSNDELTLWLDRLSRDRQWGAAYLTWVESLPLEAQRRIGNIYNGGFESEPSNMGFDWRIAGAPGARVSRVQVTGAEGHVALRVDFEDRRVAFQHVRQLLALGPGRYRLRGRVRLDDLRSERGLVWTLTCADDGRMIAETDPMSGRREWRAIALNLEVPAANCGGQWLTLRVPARIPAEQLIGGVAWFDDMEIQAARP